ncbi:MAG: 3'(2'),5'-bisphosphate nucleotidase CysQ [Lachnospiraceae bacterium]|nr:3'(2'),5'-bisphosphate nucleotidase CysQ [Lachnospiraceae bacterium]
MWDKELEISKELAVKAGIEIMDVYNNCDDMEITYKDGDMPLTIADKRANRVIIDGLRKVFSDYAVLSEEEKDNMDRLMNDYCFVVDPLDGTKEFINRNGQFTVNIALAYKHKSVMGVIYVPASGELYYATEGDGAYIVHRGGQAKKLCVSDIKDRSKIRVVMSRSHGCREMEELIKKHHLKNLISIGSSLKGCMIASGEAEVYYRFNPTMEWDTAAMQCIVEEAGGIFRQMDDTDMCYNRETSLNEKGFYVLNALYNKL